MFCTSTCCCCGWPLAGHDTADTWFRPAESQISAANVGQLQTKWVLTPGGDVTATPTEADGVVYVADWDGNLFAINAANAHAMRPTRATRGAASAAAPSP